MNPIRLLLFLATMTLGFAAESSPPAVPPPAQAAHPLAWDALEKIHEAKAGEGAAEFEFFVTNTGAREIVIDRIVPSCGCTLAEMPATPWVLAPKAKGSFRAVIDFLGRQGRFSKTLLVSSTDGAQTLTVTVVVPEPDAAARERNQQLAKADRQAVFRNDCASCHVAPAVGKEGAALFAAACAICHFAPHRAAVVPDLLVVKEPRDAAYWTKWISEGREGSLMPAFAKKHGGPLDDEQINSLVEFAVRQLPARPEGN